LGDGDADALAADEVADALTGVFGAEDGTAARAVLGVLGCGRDGEGEGEVGAETDDGAGVAPGAAAVLLTVVCAGAVRANRVASPTAVTALSWVARQVSRDRRRRPSVRAAPGGSSLSCMDAITAGSGLRPGQKPVKKPLPGPETTARSDQKKRAIYSERSAALRPWPVRPGMLVT
jgi:hypothetical protein